MKFKISLFLLLMAFLGTSFGANAQLQQIYAFSSPTDGANPNGQLLVTSNGDIYGATEAGGNLTGCYGGYGCGIVFKLTYAKNTWSKTTVYAFAGGADGAYPNGGLVTDSKGDLFGTTQYGGDFGDGTIFELSYAGGEWTKTVLHHFDGSDGAVADWPLVWIGSKLYGATVAGGTAGCSTNGGCGVVFELSKSNGVWTYKVIYDFSSEISDALQSPGGALAVYNGSLYGTTIYGGGYSCGQISWAGCGTVYKLTPSGEGDTWSKTTLFTFSGANGANPQNGIPLQIDGTGNLFGTTQYGGADNSGTIYEVSQSGVHTILHNFSGGAKDGLNPIYGVIAENGLFYGTTGSGGSLSAGTLYALSESGDTDLWQLSILNSFGTAGGWTPESIVFHSGIIYGTTDLGGGGSCTDGCGTVYIYRLEPTQDQNLKKGL
jgi:uncharacterized repeat protein (TIGR03803 family)